VDEQPPDVLAEDEGLVAALERQLREAAALAASLYSTGELSVDQYDPIAKALEDAAQFMRTVNTPTALLAAELTAARGVIKVLDDVQRGRVSAEKMRMSVAYYRATARTVERWRRRSQESPLGGEEPGSG
jgi:predicted ATP-dependent serine protease